MYLIYYDGKPLHDTRIDGCAVTSATCDLEVNTSGTLKFTIAPNHPLYDKLEAMSSEHEVVLEEDGFEWFRGRITNPGDEEMNTSRTVTVVGQLSYLNDSIVRPYGTYTDASDNPGWTTIAPGDAHGLAEWYVEQHNGQADRSKQFEIGDNQLTVASVTRSSTQWPTTGSELKDKLLDSLPCYIRARYESGKRFIDFSDDGWGTCQQRIEFGRNLTDFASVVDASGVITCIIPEGKGADGSTFGIANAADGTVADGCTKQGDHIISVDGVNRYGLVCEHRSYDDCTTTDGLIAACCADLQTAHKVVESLTIKAVDLHKADPDVKPIHLGDWVRVTSAPHGVDTIIMCMQISIDIGNPASTTYTFGAILPTLTRSTVASASEQRKAIADVVESVEPISAEAKAAAQVAGEASATATEAKTTATSAKSAADTATTVAGAAQTAAESASSAASTAQTTADSAATAASTAQTTATEAKATATTVSQHFFSDDGGAHVATAAGDATTGANTLIDSAGLAVRDGTTESSRFGASSIDLGINSQNAKINMCAANGRLSYNTSGKQVFLQGTHGAVITYLDDGTFTPQAGIGIVKSGTAEAGSESDVKAVITAPELELNLGSSWKLTCSQLNAASSSVPLVSKISRIGTIVFMSIGQALTNVVIGQWSEFLSDLASLSAVHKIAGPYQVVVVPFAANGTISGNLFLKAGATGVLNAGAWWLTAPGVTVAFPVGTEITISASWIIAE